MAKDNSNSNSNAKKLTKENLIKSGASVAVDVVGAFFPPVAIIGSILKEVAEYVDPVWVKKRCEDISDKILKKSKEEYGLSSDDAYSNINNAIAKLPEHDYFTLRRNFRYLIEEAQPEIVDPMIDAILEFIYESGKSDDKHDMSEEVVEILTEFDSHDIELLKIIKDFQKNADQHAKEKYYEKAAEEEKNRLEESGNSKAAVLTRFYDRNILRGDYTIVWEDFCDYIGLPKQSEFGQLLAEYPVKEKHEPMQKYAYIARSIIKLQNLGVFEIDTYSTLGNSGNWNIDRFHISVFGSEIMKHIKGTQQK